MATPTQTLSVEYLDYVDSSVVNARHKDIRPVGIYSGGFIKYTAGNTSVIVSPLVAELLIASLDQQVKVETTADTTVSTVSGKEYLVLYLTANDGSSAQINFVNAVELAANDHYLLIGIVDLNGTQVSSVSYYESTAIKRSTPNLSSIRLRAEVSPNGTRRVVVRGGWVNNGSTPIEFQEQESGDLTAAEVIVYLNVSVTPVVIASIASASFTNSLGIPIAKVASTSPLTAADITDIRCFSTSGPPSKASAGKTLTGTIHVSTANYSTFTDLVDSLSEALQVSLTSSGGNLLINACIPHSATNGLLVPRFRVLVDGSAVYTTFGTVITGADKRYPTIVNLSYLASGLSGGTHIVKIQVATYGSAHFIEHQDVFWGVYLALGGRPHLNVVEI